MCITRSRQSLIFAVGSIISNVNQIRTKSETYFDVKLWDVDNTIDEFMLYVLLRVLVLVRAYCENRITESCKWDVYKCIVILSTNHYQKTSYMKVCEYIIMLWRRNISEKQLATYQKCNRFGDNATSPPPPTSNVCNCSVMGCLFDKG